MLKAQDTDRPGDETMATHKLHEIGRTECLQEGCEPDLPAPADSWVCEKCATPISEDEYRVWGTCEACERAWCDRVDAAQEAQLAAEQALAAPYFENGALATNDDIVFDDEVLQRLSEARTLLNTAWKANMDAADYQWDSVLSREINKAYDAVSDLMSGRIENRVAHD